MTYVFLDANFCVVPFTKGVDIIAEIPVLVENAHIAVPDFILLELEKITKKERFAKVALKYIESEGIEVLSTGMLPKDTDSALLALAKEHNAIIATNDKALRSRAKRRNIHTLFLRSGQTLEKA
ncbi:hypothetical protein COT72_00290 [archaeon CG10_big_fil_rev_8_21_14_0_10_43_11]|nr:MAG: hypothetical protein COT72_00290 [archaeon CG10_big_fil_rev_8_21_14_0_10_43_11]